MLKGLNKFVFIFLLLLIHSFISVFPQNGNPLYVNNMDYMLADVKQAFIQDKVKTDAHVENLLKGLKAMKVNGIRIPIFPESYYPDKPILKKFITRANEEGFLLFANPVGSAGAKRVANNAYGDDDPLNVSVLNNTVKTQYYIGVLKAYAQEFECKWISPFNEDGKPGGLWSASQINTIYSSLKGNLNGAELIGHCSWGIPAGIEVMEKTNIRNYVSVSTTHNLGFDHSYWRKFIQLSREKGLPVWDSECTDNPKDGNQPRMDAALENGVDAIVMYDSWKAVDLNNGSLKSLGYSLMSKYLRGPETPYMETFADLRLSIPGLDPPQQVKGSSGITFVQGDATKATFSSTSSLINGSNAMILLNNKGRKGWFELPLANGIHALKFYYTRSFANANPTALTITVGDTTVTINNITQTVGSFYLDNLNINDSTSVRIQLSGDNACTIDSFVWVDQYGGSLPLGMEKTESSGLKIYPNPASELIHVTCDEPIKQMILTDLTGKIVASFMGTATINVSNIKAGNYILQVQTVHNTYSKKVIICHSDF
jgi:hypothetical protein